MIIRTMHLTLQIRTGTLRRLLIERQVPAEHKFSIHSNLNRFWIHFFHRISCNQWECEWICSEISNETMFHCFLTTLNIFYDNPKTHFRSTWNRFRLAPFSTMINLFFDENLRISGKIRISTSYSDWNHWKRKSICFSDKIREISAKNTTKCFFFKFYRVAQSR